MYGHTNNLDQVLVKVSDELKVVFCNILQGNRGNDMLKENRGKEGRKIKIENVSRELDADSETNKDIDLNNHEEVVDDDDDAQIQFIQIVNWKYCGDQCFPFHCLHFCVNYGIIRKLV